MTQVNTQVTSSLAALRQIIPSAIINSTPDQACYAVIKCLLGNYINNDTNIPELLTQLENSCPTLINSFSNISIDSLENLNNVQNLEALINLIMAAIISIVSIRNIVTSINIQTDDTTIYDISFLTLISFLLVALIEKSQGFKDFIANQDNCNTLFNFLGILESAYNSFLRSVHLLEELKSIFKQLETKSLNKYNKCCICFKKTSTKALSVNDINQKIALRTIAFKNAVEIANLKNAVTHSK